MATLSWHSDHIRACDTVTRSPGRPSPPRPASSSAAGGFGVDRPPAAAAEPERRRPGPAPTRQSTQSVQSTLSSQSRTDAASSSLSRTPPRPQSRPSGGRQAPQPSVEAAHTFPPSQQLRHRISEVGPLLFEQAKNLWCLPDGFVYCDLISAAGKHHGCSRRHHS